MTAHISPVKTCIFDKETWFGTAQYGFWKTALKEVNKGGWLDQFHSSHLICQAEIQGYMVSVSSYQPKEKSQPCRNQYKFCPWTWWDQAPGDIFKGILNQVRCIVWIVKQEFNFLKKICKVSKYIFVLIQSITEIVQSEGKKKKKKGD